MNSGNSLESLDNWTDKKWQCLEETAGSDGQGRLDLKEFDNQLAMEKDG